VQIKKKQLLIDRQPSGAYLFHDNQFVLDAVRNLRNHVLNCIDLRIYQPHQEGH
jgi:arabinogalactan endo-1,4-beta-galactosidase